MNTKELIIGDFVRVRVCVKRQAPFTEQIFGIYPDGQVMTSVGKFTAGEIEPILLTDEILDKNAKRCDLTTAKRWTIRIPNKFYLQIYRWRGENHYEVLNGVCLEYVHELQHALRLCGEYELADNLKLE